MAGNLEELVSSIRSGQQLDRLQAAINAAKIVNLPAGADYHYYNSFKSYQQPVSEVLSRVKDLLLQTARGEPDGAEALADLDSAHEWVVSALDDSLERVDVAVDAARTQLKAAATAALQAPQQTGSAGPAPAASAPVRPSSDKKRSRGEFQRFNAGPSSGPRPQDQFEDAVDNSNMPFKPRCIHLGAAAAAAAAPAAAALSAADKRIAAHAQRLGLSTVVAAVEVHPLGAVLSTLCYQPWQLEASTPQPPRGLDKAPLTYVDTPAELQRITERLKQAREIAIDLENHHYRSFQGFSCLMQLSTRSEDFIVDTLALRSELGRHFGPIFADVRVVKVLHGADSDILWLQRDFGIYVANMFDTGQAARVLEFPGLGLAYLLQHFCDIKADKKYQLADWRVRPLSPEMLHYARSDTHYLLYIYDRLKEELLAQADRVPANLCVQLPAEVAPGALGTVLERSRRLCLQLYEKELFTETSYLDLYNRCRETNPLDAEQLAVFAGLFAWRDRIARELDESTGYVMSRNTLLKLATRMPSSPKELQAVVGRSSAVIVDKLEEVTRVIAAAREQAPSAAAQLQQQRQQKKEQQQAHTAAAKLQQQQPRGQQQQEQREQSELVEDDAMAEEEDASSGGAAPPGADGGLAAASATQAASAGSSEDQHDAKRLRLSPGQPGLQPPPVSVAAAADVSPLVPKAIAPIKHAAGGTLGASFTAAASQTAAETTQPTGGLNGLFAGKAAPTSHTAVSGMAAMFGGRRAQTSRQPLTSAAAPAQQPLDPDVVDPRTSAVDMAADASVQALDAATTATTATSAGQPVAATVAKAATVQLASAGSSLAGMFGSRASHARPVKQAVSALGSMFGRPMPPASSAGGQSDAAAQQAQQAERLRQQFTLPFSMTGALLRAVQPAAGDAAGGPELEGDNAEGTQGDTGAEVHPQRTTGAAIRALADQLRAENDANGEFTGISAERQPPGLSLAVANVAATCSADAMAGSAGAQQAKRKAGKKGDQGDWDEQEFLPLAISESYKMPKKRRRGADQRPQGRDADQPVGVPSGLGTQADSPARRSTGRYHNADYGSDHADQLDHQQGVADADALYSSANEAGEGEGEEGSPASGGSGGAPQQAGSAPSNRHASRSSTAAQRAGLESEDESGDDSGPEERALGPCFPRDSPQPEGRRHARDGMRSPNNPNGERRGNQAQHAGDVELGVPQDEPLPFDYAAARAAAPGLDISGSLNRRRNQQRGRGGRGGRSGGRGDRGRGRDRGRSGGRGAGSDTGKGAGRGSRGDDMNASGGGGCKQAGKQKRVFNPYQMDDAETIKGGKRSSVMPRSGNRSMTFK